MTLRYARYLSLLAWVAALVSPLLIAPAVAQTGDYDSEDNRLIDITTLAQLNAIRYDLDGNGTVADSDTANYNAAFPNAATGMGCPSTGCNGYELKANLDFDTDESGVVDASDNPSYPNWAPIGGTYSAPFKGNNNTISNLTMDRSGDAGLFFALSDTVEGLGLSKVNVVSTNVSGALAANLNSSGAVIGCWSTGTVRGNHIGGLIGYVRGRVAASFSAANVTATGSGSVAGGLAYDLAPGGRVVASYATGTVTGIRAGGLLGLNDRGTVRASYAFATVNGGTSVAGADYGITAYDDFDTGVPTYTDVVFGGIGISILTGIRYGCYQCGGARSAATLQAPTSPTGIYAAWDSLDVNGNTTEDEHPWTFGKSDQFPVLKYAGMDTTSQYDLQPPGMPQNVAVTALVDSLAVLWNEVNYATGYRVQWKAAGENYDASVRQSIVTGMSDTTDTIPNLTGGTTYTVRVIATKTGAVFDSPPSAEQTGIPTVDYDSEDNRLIDITTLAQLNAMRYDLNGDGAVANSDTAAYNAAFPNRPTGMGCPSTGCNGYELKAALDFDTDGSGVVDASDSPSFPNWAPIGPFNINLPSDGAYTATFKGNNNTISNLTITSTTTRRVGLFGIATGNITGVGLPDANVTYTFNSSGLMYVGALAGLIQGTVRSCWATGVVSVTSTASAGPVVGGLVGTNRAGTLAASWADVAVSVNTNGATSYAGGLAGDLSATSGGDGTIIASYAIGSVSNTSTGTTALAGGLVGNVETQGGTNNWIITASYATGPVSSNGTSGGLLARIVSGSAGSTTASYWDTRTTNIADDADADAPEGKTTSELQMPTAYGTQSSDIYMSWNVNVDGMVGNDDPWDFGAADQYPVLKFNRDADAIAAQFARQPVPQVRGVSVTPGPGTLVVSWTAATNADGYKVQWKSGSENYAADRQAVVTDGTTHTIPNLSAAAEYAIRVIATRTNFDDGLASDEATGRPGLAKVPGVQVTPGSSALAVSWTAVPNATGYKVQWKSGDEDYDAADRQAVVTEGVTHTIPNLSMGTEYTVRVIATFANADDGPASDEATGTPGESGTTEPEPDPDTEPVFIEAADPQTYRLNRAIEFTLPAAIDGNGTLTYTLTDLPEGLTFDAETLIVSGTPSEATEKAIYTLTVTDEDGDSAEMSFFITVLVNMSPSFGDASVSAQSYMRKREIDSLTLPQATGGDGTLTYVLTPDLPDGLKFDAETLMLSGNPLEAIAETTYTLTATDDDGDAAPLMFTLEVMTDPIPTFGDTTLTVQGYQQQEIEPLALPQATGGDEPLTYALTPDLPDGLNFDAETLIVSGTPIKAMDATTYTLTATDGNGDVARLMFTLEIPDLMPTFGDTTIAASYLVYQRIESLTLPPATSGDGTLAYFLLPFLPDDLSFDPDTRTIAGTPIEAMPETTYTLTALDADGDVASLTFTLAVSMPSPDIDGDGNVNFADFLTFASKFGSRFGQDRYDARCDLNTDGQIDFADFLIFAASFGATG